jgi:hypothetical protein
MKIQRFPSFSSCRIARRIVEMDSPRLFKAGCPRDQNVRTRGRGGYQGTAQRTLFAEVTNHPVCAAKERDLLINGAATLENGGEC